MQPSVLPGISRSYISNGLFRHSHPIISIISPKLKQLVQLAQLALVPQRAH